MRKWVSKREEGNEREEWQGGEGKKSCHAYLSRRASVPDRMESFSPASLLNKDKTGRQNVRRREEMRRERKTKY